MAAAEANACGMLPTMLMVMAALLLGLNIGKLLPSSTAQQSNAIPTAERSHFDEYQSGVDHSILPQLKQPQHASNSPTPIAHVTADNSSVGVKFTIVEDRTNITAIEDPLRFMRVHVKDGGLAQDHIRWYGDHREGPPLNATGKALDQWKRYPGPPAQFPGESLKAALDDPRGIVFGGGHGGLGNQLWAAAGVFSVARVTNRLPVLACNSCYRHEALRQFHCIPTNRGWPAVEKTVTQKSVGWGEASMAAHNNVIDYQTAKEKLLTITGFLQSWHNMQDDAEGICWGLQPRAEIQKAAQDYFDGILTNVTITEHTRVVTVHLRRGDYVGKQAMHGLLTVEYYTSGLKMIRDRLTKVEPVSAKEGMVVVVLTEQENVAWCNEHFKWGETEGVKATICADAKGTRCRGEIVDMIALGLGDFLIIANSSFSWWAHFLGHCKKSLLGWWSYKSITYPHRSQSKMEATVMPHRWYTKRLTRDRSKTFDVVPSNILVPEPKNLFEAHESNDVVVVQDDVQP
eukprot:m.42197 g.42197  ORF g.42197 m.42197 type:complete len:515 (+) comp19034_c0_seq1:226-1770(+)